MTMRSSEKGFPKRPAPWSSQPKKPMIHPHTSPRRASLLCAAVSLSVVTSPSLAAVKTWDGGGSDSNWQTGPNWDADTAPLAGDSLIFQGAAGLSSSNNFAADTKFAGLSFAAGAGNFTLAGNGITLAGNLSNNSSGIQTVGTPVKLGTGTFVFAGSTTAGATLALGSITVPPNAGGAAVFTPNAGGITTTGTNTHGILGAWATVGTTTNGVNWATVDGSGQILANTVYTDVPAASTIPGDPANNVRMLGAANLGGASADINTLKSSAAGGNGNDVTNIGAGNTLRFGTMGGILNDTGVANNMRIGGNTGNTGVGSVTAGGPNIDTPGMLVLHAAATASTHNNVIGILSTLTDNGTGAVTVVKTGLGSSYFQSANSYSGGTYINQGHIQGNIGTSFGTGPIRVAPGGQAFLNATSTFANNIFISGTGLPTDNSGSLRLSNATVTGAVTLEGNSRIQVNGGASPGTMAAINGQISGPYSLDYNAFGNAGQISNLTLGNTGNNWSGNTNLIAASNSSMIGTLRLGASEVIPHGASAGNVAMSGTAAAGNVRIDLNGLNETINGLNSAAGGLRFQVTNLAATDATLTLGANDANGDFGGAIFQATSPAGALHLVKTGSGTQILRGDAHHYAGTTSVNAGRLQIIGNPIADGAITVTSGGTLALDGSVTGPVTVNNGGRFVSSATAAGFPATLFSLSLDAGSTIDIDTATLPVTPIELLGPLTTLGGANSVTINLSGAAPAVGLHPLISYATGSLTGTGFPAFKLGTTPRLTGTLVHNPVLKTISLDVTAMGDAVVWTGGKSSEWSTGLIGTPKNWKLGSNASPTDFLPGDTVIFNDSAANNTVDISTADVAIGSVSFENTADTYLVTGSKGMSGSGVVVMSGGGTVTLANNNSYTGDTVIASGTLEVGNGGTAGTIGTGQVANDGVLVFNRSNASTQPNPIIGSGEVRHIGTGTTTLSGNGSYNGDTTISAGTLRVTNTGSLGAPAGMVQVQGGAALDLGGGVVAGNMNFGSKQFLISGNGPDNTGAIVNAGGPTQGNALQFLGLEADASVGGSARFDLRGVGSILDLNGHVLRKRGAGQFSMVNSVIQEGGTIIVEQGTLSFETAASTEGSSSVTYQAGTNAQFYQNNLDAGGIDWTLILHDNVGLGNAGTVLATVPAPIVLQGDAVLVPFDGGARDPADNKSIVLSGNITEAGGSHGIRKIGVNTVTLSGMGSTYTGATLVNAGTLEVNGSVSGSPFTVAAAPATLGGTGTIGGTVASSGILAPGLALTGTLGTGATTLSAPGSLQIQIDSTTLASDKLAVTGALNLGGATLALTDLGAVALPVDTKFVIASHTGITGVFANAPDGGTITVGPNRLKIDYDEVVSAQTSITLTVVAGTAYDDWAVAKGLNGTNNGKMADPDGDGLENIVEFGLDQEPLLPGDGGKLRAMVADVDAGAPVDNAYTLTVPMRAGADFTGSAPGDLLSAALDGVIYRVEGSATLTSFPLDITEVTPALSAGMTIPTTGWTYRSFRLPGAPGSPHPKAFLRVDVAEAP